VSWQLLSPDACALGESPFWHPDEQTLYWVDIVGKKLLRANVYTGTVQSWHMPSEPGCIAPALRGGLVVALRTGVAYAPAWGGALESIERLAYDPQTVRANDGKCDQAGRLWVGTIDETRQKHAAQLFSLDCRGPAPQVRCQADGALTGNGLAWSPDNRTLYWADTSSHVVRAWDFDLSANTLANPRIFVQFAPKPEGWTPEQGGYGGRPDGAAVDVQGNYYVSMYEGARVCKFAPDGGLLAEYPTPIQCPTMPCFGGEDLKTLYLTSARHGRSAAELTRMPHSGCVFYMRVQAPGLPVNFFAH
jgi:sugar lactone lactonase YvrE